MNFFPNSPAHLAMSTFSLGKHTSNTDSTGLPGSIIWSKVNIILKSKPIHKMDFQRRQLRQLKYLKDTTLKHGLRASFNADFYDNSCLIFPLYTTNTEERFWFKVRGVVCTNLKIMLKHVHCTLLIITIPYSKLWLSTFDKHNAA